MNIIEAREAAMAGKTVICPSGFNYSKASFSNVEEWDKASIFGEWRVKQEPVVFETTVLPSGLEGNGILSHQNLSVLGSLIGKRVKVSVEVLP